MGRNGIDANGPVDEQLTDGDENKEDEVENDHHVEGVIAAGKVLPGDGQWDADAGLTVELPVRGAGQQGDSGQKHADDPQVHTSHVRRPPSEAKVFVREADDQEPLESDETDEEGGHLAGQERQEAGYFAGCAVGPGCVVPAIVVVDSVSHADDGQVHAHQEIRHTQVRNENIIPHSDGGLFEKTSVDKAPQITDQGQEGIDSQENPKRFRAKQSIAGGNFVNRSVAVLWIEVCRQDRWAAQFVVVCVDKL